jgi:DNA-binding Lrp family transcriptional regulator
MAREPASATELAARLDLPRQRVNYHVRQLARSGFLRRAGQIRKKNLIEQRYVATARAYVLAPALLGPLAAAGHLPTDVFSAGRLIGLAAEAQADVSHALRESAARGLRLSTLSMSADLRFESPAQRLAFTEALQAAVTDVVGRFSSPSATPEGSPAPGRPFRLFLACYPRPPRSRLKP